MSENNKFENEHMKFENINDNGGFAPGNKDTGVNVENTEKMENQEMFREQALENSDFTPNDATISEVPGDINQTEGAQVQENSAYSESNNAVSERNVGESAGIRYNADNTGNTGAYTWQYCQSADSSNGKSPLKKRNKLKICALIVASVLVVGALTAASLVVVDKLTQSDRDDNFKFDNRFSGYDSEKNSDLPIIGQNKSPDSSRGETDAYNAAIVIDPNAEGGLSKQAIAVKCKPSSVGIEVVATIPSYFGYSYKSSGVGSGFILTEDGYVATNNHVIEGADEIVVMLDDGTRYNARVIGADSVTDLAVIKIDATGLVPMEIGDSDLMRVGDSVIAIGTPAGIEFAGTVTDGIVSAINRDVEVSTSNGYTKTMTLMQTNAAINPGNSGGPLINSKGQVVGINTLKLNERYEGIGFSIPINSAVKIFNQLITDGKVTDYDTGFVTGKGSIGITNYDEVDKEKAEYYGIPEGIIVIQMKPGCSSQKAGLRRGDIITAFNGKKVTTAQQLNKLKDEFNAGDEVTLTVYRDEDEQLDIVFTLDVMG